MALRKFLILRRPRSGRLEGRAMLIQRLCGFPHSLESGGPGQAAVQLPWIPAFAGMTFEKVYRTRLPNLAPMTLILPHCVGEETGSRSGSESLFCVIGY